MPAKKRILTLVAALLALALCAQPAAAKIFDHFAVGASVKSFELTGDKAFTGTITADTVDEKQMLYPSSLNMIFGLCPNGGIIAQFDHFGATMQADGNLYWDTITLGLIARHHFKKWHLAPYAVAGLTYNSVRFDENYWWRYGYSSVSDFDTSSAGKTPDEWKTERNRLRNMDTDDAIGYTYGGGVDIFLTKHLALNLDVRWDKASTDVDYTIYVSGKRDLDRQFSYSLDTLSYSVGLRWYF